ncbi:MAG: hypothetical protein AAF085_07295 [Planctomycetota bacterium]
MAMLTKAQVKKNLKEIEAYLIERVPEMVKAKSVDGPVYVVLLCYHDLTVEEYTPVLIIAKQSIRDNHEDQVKQDSGRAGWVPHIEFYESDDVFEIRLEDEAFSKLCNDVYETISDDWEDQDEEEVIRPFRKSMYKASKALNKLDWSAYLEVTDDFVVAVTDYVGHLVDEDIPASIPRKKRKILDIAGWFGEPVPPGRHPFFVLTDEINAMPVDQRIIRLIEMLEKMHRDEKTGPFDGDTSQAVKLLSECKKPAQVPMIRFVEGHIGETHISYEKRKSNLRQLNHILGMMPWVDGVDPQIESLLQSIIRKSLPEAEQPLIRGTANRAALHLHSHFEGYPEPKDVDPFTLATNIEEFLR